MIYTLWAIGLLAAALIIFTLLGIYRLLTPTRGRSIDRRTRPGEALLVIDMQSDFTTKTGRKGYDSAAVETAIASVNALAARAHAVGMPVVSIRQVVTAPLAAFIGRYVAGPEGIVGSPGIGLDPRLQLDATRDFTKDRGDAFSNPALERWLDERKIGRLRLVGLDGCYCVRLTTLGALNRGYDVTILEEGVLAMDAERWTARRDQLVRRGVSLVGAAGENIASTALPDRHMIPG